jgi:hypothetical protein
VSLSLKYLLDVLDVVLVDEDVNDLSLDLVTLLDGLHHDEVSAFDPDVFPELGRHGNLHQIYICNLT